MSVGGQVPILSGAEATRVDTRDVSEADTRGPRDAALLLRGTQQPGAEGKRGLPGPSWQLPIIL